MALEKGKISSSQLIFLVVSEMLGVGFVIPPGATVNQDAWIAIIFALFGGLLLALVQLNLAARFPGKTLVRISELVYGNFLGKLISLLYILFFFHIASLMVIDFSNFFNLLFMTSTPFIVFMISITLVAASGVRNGIEVIARCAQFIIPIVFISTIITGILLAKDFNLENFQPVLEASAPKMAWIVYRTAIFSFSPLHFLMIIPFTNKQGEVKKSVIKATFISASLLIFVAVRNIGVLGITGSIYTYPSFQAVRLINYGEILTRLEILIALNFMGSGFLQYALTFYITTLAGAQLLNLRTYLPLVLPIGVLLTFQLHYYNIVETMEYQNVYPFIATIFHVIIPVMTLIIATIRKLPRGES